MDSEDQTGKFRKNRRNKRKIANLCGSFNAEKRNCNSFSCPGKTKYYVDRFLDFFWPTLYVLIVRKKSHFLNPPTQSYDYVIFEWSLSNIKTKRKISPNVFSKI